MNLHIALIILQSKQPQCCYKNHASEASFLLQRVLALAMTTFIRDPSVQFCKCTACTRGGRQTWPSCTEGKFGICEPRGSCPAVGHLTQPAQHCQGCLAHLACSSGAAHAQLQPPHFCLELGPSYELLLLCTGLHFGSGTAQACLGLGFRLELLSTVPGSTLVTMMRCVKSAMWQVLILVKGKIISSHFVKGWKLERQIHLFRKIPFTFPRIFIPFLLNQMYIFFDHGPIIQCIDLIYSYIKYKPILFSFPFLLSTCGIHAHHSDFRAIWITELVIMVCEIINAPILSILYE